MKARLSLLDTLTVAVFSVQAAFALHMALTGAATTVPLHWNAAFAIDRWGSLREFSAWFGLIALIGMIATAGLGLGALRATAEGDSSRARSLRIAQGVTLFTFTALGVLIMRMTLGGNGAGAAGPGLTMGVLSLIFLAIGAFLGRVAPNPVIGVRTPWTYKSRLAWDRSNRLAGRLLSLLGLAGIIAAPIAPQPAGMSALIAAVVIIAALSVVESWRVWRADPDRQPF